MLYPHQQSKPQTQPGHNKRTSFLVTGFSNKTRCVSRRNVASTSKSANSAKLFAVKTSVVRLGMEFASDGWMPEILLRASNKVRNRADRGKLPSSWISLSVKSIASWGYCPFHQHNCPKNHSRIKESAEQGTYASNTQVLNRGDFMSCR